MQYPRPKRNPVSKPLGANQLAIPVMGGGDYFKPHLHNTKETVRLHSDKGDDPVDMPLLFCSSPGSTPRQIPGTDLTIHASLALGMVFTCRSTGQEPKLDDINAIMPLVSYLLGKGAGSLQAFRPHMTSGTWGLSPLCSDRCYCLWCFTPSPMKETAPTIFTKLMYRLPSILNNQWIQMLLVTNDKQ